MDLDIVVIESTVVSSLLEIFIAVMQLQTTTQALLDFWFCYLCWQNWEYLCEHCLIHSIPNVMGLLWCSVLGHISHVCHEERFPSSLPPPKGKELFFSLMVWCERLRTEKRRRPLRGRWVWPPQILLVRFKLQFSVINNGITFTFFQCLFCFSLNLFWAPTLMLKFQAFLRLHQTFRRFRFYVR